MFGGATGITRLFQSDMGSQISWLLPAALIALAALLWLSRRSPRTDRTRAAALLWGGWLVVTGVVFSYMSGIIHPYYTVALAPAIAALAGIGAVALWRIRHTWAARVTLAGTLLVTAAWAWVLLDRSPGWLPWLRVAIAIAAAAAAAMILAGPARPGASSRRRTVMAAAALALALAAGLGGPLAYSIDTAATAHTGSIPTAGPAGAGSTGAGSAGGPGGGQPGAGGFAGTTGSSRAGGTAPGEASYPGGTARTTRRSPDHRRDGQQPRRDGQHQQCPVLAARIRGVRLPVGGGRGRVAKRGLPRTGQQRGSGHGDRRLHRQRPGPDPGPVREARLRSRDPLLRGQRIWRTGRRGRRFRARVADHRLGEGPLHRQDRRRDDGLRPDRPEDGLLTATEQLKQPALTSLVARLERDGLVSRGRDPSDGRAVLISLTAEGREIVASRHADRMARLARPAEQLDDQERDVLAGCAPVLARLTEIAAGQAS